MNKRKPITRMTQGSPQQRGRDPCSADWENLSRQELIDRLERLQSQHGVGQAAAGSGHGLDELHARQNELEVQNRELEAIRGRLEQTRDRYAHLYDHAPVGYVTLDAQGRIEEINFSAARLLGGERGKLVGKSLAGWIAAGDEGIFEQHLKRVFEDHFRKCADELFLGNPARFFPVRLESIATRNELDATMRCHTAILDITQQKRAEAESRRQQAELAHIARLTTAGEMASSMAHELNQPLGAIALYCQTGLRMLRNGKCDVDKLANILEQSAVQAQRAGEFIRRLREFVRKGETKRSDLDLNAVVREAIELIRPEARDKQITLRLDLHDGLPAIHADRILIEQVLLNLMRNGVEAMHGGKCEDRKLYIRTQRLHEKVVRISVRDTGPGLGGDTAAMLDPFFTTKPDGIGMGLSISRSIIEAHAGHLWIEPHRQGGAVSYFTLPAMAG